MSDPAPRTVPTRGRSSVRGGRGGFGRGGPRGGHRQTNGASNDFSDPSLDEPSEIGDLKRQYSSQLSMLKDMFPDWSDVDLVFALQENDGDLQTTTEKITEGQISQFSEIKKPKDRARSKVAQPEATTTSAYPTRGGRGRGGAESVRGGRGRGDRARGAPRGGRGAASVVRDAADAVPGISWESTTAAEPSTSNDTDGKSAWESDAAPKTAAEAPTLSSVVPEAISIAKKTWASMFSQPKPAPAPAAPPKQETPATAEPVLREPSEAEAGPEAPEAPQDIEAVQAQSSIEEPEAPVEATSEALEPSSAPLTEDNLEHLPDSSIPPATHTAASTVGSDAIRQATPLAHQAPIGRPILGGGYASTAQRATSGVARSASFQKRIIDQQEAVVLPGHSAVDRAAVQFGSMGLNGDQADVDDEREEAETRAQPPQQSPAQPRASLPQLQASLQSHDAYTAQPHSTPKQAPGLPPVSQQSGPSQQADLSTSHQQQYQQSYNQYNRYGQQDTTAQKPYDPFSHQTPSSLDQFSQAHSQGQQPQQTQPAGYGQYSSAPSDNSQYYTSEQQRNAYQNYYGGSYGQQQQAHSQQQDGAQQRGASNTGVTPGQGEGAFGSSQPQQARYDQQSSEQSQPSALGGQQSNAPAQQSQQQQHQQHQQTGYNSGFPYGHPYYNSPYATAYANQFTYPYGGGPYGKQQGIYQPQGYGPSSYEHSSSPANTGYAQQASLQSRDSNVAAGGADYGRSSATQASGIGSSGFGGASDYGRTSSGYPSQSQDQLSSSYGRSTDEHKPYGSDTTKATGPSPALGQPGNRPGSAANSSAAGQGGAGLPAPQIQQQGQAFGGYPGFDSRAQGYGSGLGGLGGNQHTAQGGYGGYGNAGFGQSYNQYGRGGWNQSYGGQ